MALPYHDGDLAALADARGLVPRQPPPAGGPGWRGALAARWRAEGVSKDGLRRLLHELASLPRACPRCEARFSVLPARKARCFPCPKCGDDVQVEAHRKGIPPLAGWEPRPPNHATLRLGSDAPHRETTERSSSNYTSSDLRRTGGLRVGDLAGPYRILGELSRGAMGVVYRAAHAEVGGRPVALKVLQTWITDEEGRLRFEREGEALARVSHPHVVKVLRSGFLDDGRAYLVMELVEGPTLEEKLEGTGGKLPYLEAAQLMAKAAQGVGVLHGAGVIHRDLKLANVLLRDGAEPVVLDLGLVHLLDRHTRLTQAGDMLGTPLYMAPELVRGESEIGPPVDVYALGVILFRLIAGEFPFTGATTDELLHAVLTEPLDFDPSWPRPLCAVLNTALAYEPEERYPQASALAEDLDALTRGAPVKARLPTPWRRYMHWARRKPALAAVPWALALLMLLVGGGVAGFRWRARHKLEQELSSWLEEVAGLCAALESGKDPKGRWKGPAKGIRERLAATSVSDLPSVAGARGLLQEALTQLELAGERADVLASLDASPSEDPDEIVARCETLAESALPVDPARSESLRFLRLRTSLRLRLGRAEAAHRDLAGYATLPAELGKLRAVATRLAGRTPSSGDALQVARWALDRVACASPVERSPLLASATKALSALAAGEERELFELRAALWRDESTPQRIGTLRALRALRLRVRRSLRPRVLACEARLLGELGWWDSAAETWGRAGLGSVPLELWPAPVDRLGTLALAPARLAVVAGQAWAWARTTQGGSALKSARQLLAASRRGPALESFAVLGAAIAAEEAALAGESDDPLAPYAGHALAGRARARIAAWRSAQPAPARTEVQHWTSRGAVAATAYLRALVRREKRAARERLNDGRRAYRLALSAGEPPAPAWAGLAWIEERSGNAPQARASLQRSRGGEAGLGGVWSRAALMPGDEGAQAVVAASRQASEGLAAEDSTLGFARRYLLLLDGYLHRSESSERLILVRELRRLSDDVPVAWRVRSSWLHELHELARAEGDEALVKETREARLVLNKASADAARGRSVVRGDVRDREIGLDEVGNMARKLLVGDPTNAYLLFYEYYRRGSLTQKGEDAALCAFGLRPRNLLRRLYSSVYYSTSVTKQDTFGGSTFLRQVQQRLDSGDLSPLPSKHLRCQAPRVLWRPFLVGHAFAVGLEPTPARLVRVLAEAEQAVLFAPRLSATLQVLGWLRLAAGDGAGARRAFAHARSQLVVFPTAVVEHEGFLLHLSARTYAAEGRHEEAAELLRQARQKAGAHVLSPQVDWIQPVVEFRVDPTDPKSQLAEAIQKLRDEKRGR